VSINIPKLIHENKENIGSKPNIIEKTSLMILSMVLKETILRFYICRTTRRSSSMFPPIDEDQVTSGVGSDSPSSVVANRPSCTSNHNCQLTLQQPRGAAIRSSASSGVLRTRKSSDIHLRVPNSNNVEHGTLVRTRSQEQVEKLSEFLFSGRDINLLDPIFSDDSSRRASAASSGKRKSVDILHFNNSRQTPGKTPTY